MTTNVINVLNRICTSSLFLFQQANYPVTWISYLEFQELLNFFLIIQKILDRFLRDGTEAHEKLENLCTLKCLWLILTLNWTNFYLVFKHFIKFHLAFHFVIGITRL